MRSSEDNNDGDLDQPASKKGKQTSKIGVKKETERNGEGMPGTKDRE
jgi:hypothetical protein